MVALLITNNPSDPSGIALVPSQVRGKDCRRFFRQVMMSNEEPAVKIYFSSSRHSYALILFDKINPAPRSLKTFVHSALNHSEWTQRFKSTLNYPPDDIWSRWPSEQGSNGRSFGDIRPFQGPQLQRVAMAGKLHWDEPWVIHSRHTGVLSYEAPTAMK
ncbi:hypothetical protein BDR22DRAFT_964416, partial [Usnea florida]